jgi:hypothetical protein
MTLRRLSQNVPRVSCGADLFSEQTQRTQRLHREERYRDFLCKALVDVNK